MTPNLVPKRDMDNSVMLLDKDQALCRALEKYLARYGYNVIDVEPEQPPFDRISKYAPAIIISGMEPGEITGLDLLRTIKQSFPDIQLIMMIENHELDAALECLHAGASDYLNKPINSKALAVALERACGKRALLHENTRYQQELEISKRNKALFQQLFDEVPCYISLQDVNFRLTGANLRFKKDFGDHVGAYCYEIYKHRNEPCRDCPVEATFADGTAHETEEVVTSQYGEQYNVLTWTAPLRDEAGNITQVMEMSTNITQIRKLQSHLASLGLLVGSMSHGIRGVLTALDGGLYRLEKGIRNGDQKKIEQALDVVKSMIHRIQTMVLDILYYTKERDLHWTRVNVTDFANQIAALIKPKAQKHRVEYVYELNCSETLIEIDPGTVSSALVNILENAIDACIDDKDDRKIHRVIFRVNENSDHVFFESLDNGSGMNRQMRENLFSLFFSSKGNRGTGLGLFIANQIIQQHGGTIEVESHPGEGSHFRIKLLKTLPDSVKQKKAAETLCKDNK